MRRRDFLALAVAAAASPSASLAQVGSRVPRIAWLSLALDPAFLAAFHEGLRERGYVNGRNVVVEVFTSPTNGELPAVAAAAVRSAPDVIAVYGTPASLAAKAATSTIPVVFTVVTDPVGVGLVASLARPGGNVTGNTNQAPGVVAKQISIVKETVPKLVRLAVAMVPADPNAALYRPQVQDAAGTLGVVPVFVDFAEGSDFAGQFARVLATQGQALYLPAFTFLNSNRDLTFDLLRQARLPSISSNVTLTATTPFSGMVGYATQAPAVIRRSASFVDAILKGARPADLPVEQPTVFDFAVNLDSARRIGITIPSSILAQATLVVDEDWRSAKVTK